MNEYYMYGQSSKYTSNLTGQPQYNNRFAQPFEMNTSAQHKQFHEMKAEMPSDVLELFKANDIAFIRAPVKPKCRALDPVTVTCKDIDAMFDIPNENLMEMEKGESKEEKAIRIRAERKQHNIERIQKEIQDWNPFIDEKIPSTDPEKTLIVARLNFKTTEKNLRFQFEKYGIIKSVRIVRDSEGVSRGYGFVEFDSREDFVSAYKSANHRKIDGYKVIVDFERGRTLLKWRPRKFGGGKGYLRLTREEIQVKEKEQLMRQRHRDHEQRERSRQGHNHRHEEKDRKKQRRSSREKKDKKEKKQKKEKKEKKENTNEIIQQA